MTFVNLTSHTINEITSGKEFPPSGRVARVKSSTVKVAEYDGCPLYASTFGELQGLPDPVEGTVYIVASLALKVVDKDRTDVVAPGNLQRDEHGQPVGCIGFRIE